MQQYGGQQQGQPGQLRPPRTVVKESSTPINGAGGATGSRLQASEAIEPNDGGRQRGGSFRQDRSRSFGSGAGELPDIPWQEVGKELEKLSDAEVKYYKDNED